MRRYTDDIPEKYVVLLQTGRMRWRKLISVIPFVNARQSFTLFVDDASEGDEEKRCSRSAVVRFDILHDVLGLVFQTVLNCRGLLGFRRVFRTVNCVFRVVR